jgi:hypothetical protein
MSVPRPFCLPLAENEPLHRHSITPWASFAIVVHPRDERVAEGDVQAYVAQIWRARGGRPGRAGGPAQLVPNTRRACSYLVRLVQRFRRRRGRRSKRAGQASRGRPCGGAVPGTMTGGCRHRSLRGADGGDHLPGSPAGGRLPGSRVSGPGRPPGQAQLLQGPCQSARPRRRRAGPAFAEYQVLPYS